MKHRLLSKIKVQKENIREIYSFGTLFILGFLFFYLALPISAQESTDSKFLSLERIYSGEFQKEYSPNIQWIDDGDAYVIIEKSESMEGPYGSESGSIDHSALNPSS